MGNQIKRSLYYYELFAFEHDIENNSVYKDRTNKYINEFFSQIANSQSSASDYSDFIVKTSQGTVFILIDKVLDDKTYFFRIVLCRGNALPYIEKGGKLESLGNYIDSDQNIAEITHCIYYGKYGVLGAEYNYNGARCAILADYIMKFDDQSPIIQCHPKFNNDALKKLSEDKEYSLFEISVKTNSSAYINILSNKSIFNVLQATAPNSDTLEVVIKQRKTKKNGNRGFDNPLSKEEIKELITTHREGLVRFKLSQSSFSECVDLLSDKFVGKTTLVKTEERTVDSESMYNAINRFFKNNVEEYC